MSVVIRGLIRQVFFVERIRSHIRRRIRICHRIRIRHGIRIRQKRIRIRMRIRPPKMSKIRIRSPKKPLAVETSILDPLHLILDIIK